MSLDYWANVAEVVGLGLVIVTFVYLSVQIRQNSRSMHSQTAQGIHNSFMEGFKMFCHDDELNRVYRIGILNPEALDDNEEAKFYAFLAYFTASMYNAHHHHITYAVDRDVTTSWLEGYQQVYNTPGFKAFWPQRKHFYSQRFIEYIEACMTEPEVEEEADIDSGVKYKPFTTRDTHSAEEIRQAGRDSNMVRVDRPGLEPVFSNSLNPSKVKSQKTAGEDS